MQNKNVNFTQLIYRTTLCVSFAYLPFSMTLYAQTNADALSGVQTEISRQEQLLSSKNERLSQLQTELERQEQAISQLVNDIREVDASLAEMQESIQKLEFDSRQLENRKTTQVKELKELLNSQYRQGKHGNLKAILSGDGAVLDRMTVYAEHLSTARSKIIAELEATSTELQLKHHSLNSQKKQKTNMLNKLNEDKSQLEKTGAAQQETAKQIQQQIKNDKSYLSELKENARQLTLALEKAKKEQAEREAEEARLAKIRAEQAAKEKALNEQAEKERALQLARAVRMDGIGKSKGKLNWPVKGKLLHSFGSQQSGQLRWHGIVISDKAGAEVEAIHDGTVVLSSWLRGYGLMLVIDHGKGDMSFYGYNQTLLHKVGDKVKAGDTIALVGNSGGQTSPGLYFEIRRKGEAVNPTPWLKKRKK